MNELPVVPQEVTQDVENATELNISDEVKKEIKDKFGWEIPPTCTQINTKTLDLLRRLQKKTGEEVMWHDDQSGKEYMETGSYIILGTSFRPPITEVLYSDELKEETHIFR